MAHASMLYPHLTLVCRLCPPLLHPLPRTLPTHLSPCSVPPGKSDEEAAVIAKKIADEPGVAMVVQSIEMSITPIVDQAPATHRKLLTMKGEKIPTGEPL